MVGIVQCVARLSLLVGSAVSMCVCMSVWWSPSLARSIEYCVRLAVALRWMVVFLQLTVVVVVLFVVVVVVVVGWRLAQ